MCIYQGLHDKTRFYTVLKFIFSLGVGLETIKLDENFVIHRFCASLNRLQYYSCSPHHDIKCVGRCSCNNIHVLWKRLFRNENKNLNFNPERKLVGRPPLVGSRIKIIPQKHRFFISSLLISNFFITDNKILKRAFINQRPINAQDLFVVMLLFSLIINPNTVHVILTVNGTKY